jgi:hypothetical protein
MFSTFSAPDEDMDTTNPPTQPLTPAPTASNEQMMQLLFSFQGQLQQLMNENARLREERPKEIRNAEPKLRDPELFTGDKKKVDEFIMSCRMKIRAQPTRFPDEETKVIWASSFFSGAPKIWFQPFLERYSEGIDIPKEFVSFDNFATALRALYGDPNLVKQAIRSIRELKQVASASDYTAKFESLRWSTKLGEDALKIFFYDGLKEHVKDMLATLPVEPETLGELQTAAIRFDERAYERKMQKIRGANPPAAPIRHTEAGNGSSTPAWRAMTGNTNSPWNMSTMTATLPRPGPPAPAMDGSTPMELDATGRSRTLLEEKERRYQFGLCLICGQKGHFRRECPSYRPQRTYAAVGPATASLGSQGNEETEG